MIRAPIDLISPPAVPHWRPTEAGGLMRSTGYDQYVLRRISGGWESVRNGCVPVPGHASHPWPAEVAQARNNDRLGSVGGSRAGVMHAWGDISCARHPGNTPRVGACRRRDRLSHSNRDAQAIRARQHMQTSCHELREAVYRGSCNAQQRADPIWRVANE